MKNIIVLIFVICSVILDLAAQESKVLKMEPDVTSYNIGDKIDDFTLPSTDGHLVSPTEFKDAKGYIIVFTSNVCPFATASEDRLNQIHKDMEKMGYPVIAINSNAGEAESLEAMKSKVVEENLKFAYLKDNSSLYKKFGATKTPHVFLVDDKMILKYMGSIDDSPRSFESVENHYLIDAVHNLMNNRSPDPAITKSIGCPIKREGKAGGKRQKGPPSPKEIMGKMDLNKDNKVSKNEAKGPLAKDFDRLDVDSDGYLSKAEISNLKPGKGNSH